VRPYRERIFDFYKLKARYRWELSAPAFIALLIPITLVAAYGYDLQLRYGLTPGAPITQPGGMRFALVTFGAFILLFLSALFLGTLLHAALLVLTRHFTWDQAIGITFLSRYPDSWFRDAT
jgi:hypothetical protein